MQEYLFLFSEPPISHVSISSSNIMLDENFTPKVRKYFPLSHYNVSYLIDHFQMQI